MNAVFVFPGQGSQHPQMFSRVPESDDLPRLLDAAEALTGLDLNRLTSNAMLSDLTDTRVAQPLLYLCDWAWGRALIDVGLEPVALAGHSLGELAALAVAEVYSVEAGLELVCARSKMMAEATESVPGTMAAVLGLDLQAATSALADLSDVWVANDNAPGQVVISGTVDGVARARPALEAAGARRVLALDVSGPFHTPLMKTAALEFSVLLNAAEFRTARFPVIQNTRPTPATDADVIREALKAQMAGVVRWTESMTQMRSYDPVTLIEAGPGSVLSGLARKVDKITAVSVEHVQLETIVEEVMR
ncbi:MAG: ACP S-malonyltransferase [Clostridiales bacterium]|nr:ACP S-malonyltransferase [Clostridiales bacterium]